ncbi:MAG: hypothetical protein IKM73_08035 [Acidaminococcaceae bacterium]|nr:hypothetical protein [Acidaminococcaceae bacterium]
MNLRGTQDTTTLYYRDSSKDSSYYSISEYTGTLFYRDSSKDTSRYLSGSQLTFNLATISTQRVTALTV